jgi:hypothetical protein
MIIKKTYAVEFTFDNDKHSVFNTGEFDQEMYESLGSAARDLVRLARDGVGVEVNTKLLCAEYYPPEATA